MERNTVVLILAVVLVLGLVVVSLIRRYFLQAQQLHIRRMIHEERMKAMEQGLPIPEAGVYDELAAPVVPDLRTLRLAVLGAGLFLIFSGVGICVGFSLAADEHTSGAWSIGLIPVMAGIGLVLFHRLSAPAQGPGRPEAASETDAASSDPARD